MQLAEMPRDDARRTLSENPLAFVALAVLSTATFSQGTAEDWPQFRGPAANGNLPELHHPIEWSGTKNIAWSVSVPGSGWSSPVVVRNRIFLTSAVYPGQEKPKNFQGGVRGMRNRPKAGPRERIEFRLYCMSLTSGEILWKKTVETRRPPHAIHPSNTYATESPAAEADGVYAYFGAIGLVAGFDLEGAEKWRVELGAYPSGANFGTGSSLSLSSGRLFVQSDNDKSSFLVALDPKNGKEIWKRDRDSRTSWSTPHPWSAGGRDQLIVCGSGTVMSYDPANGEILWDLQGIGSSFSSSPTSDSERVYFGNSGPRSVGPLFAVSAKAKGSMNAEAKSTGGLAWLSERSGPGLASPVVTGEHVYVVRRSILACHNAQTGERIYRERLPEARSIAASLWAAGDRLFILDEAGSTYVVKTGAEFELVGKNKIDDLFWSTPSVAGTSLLLRGAEKLYCVRASAARVDRPEETAEAPGTSEESP